MASNLNTPVTAFGGRFLGRHVVRALCSGIIASASRSAGRNWPGTCSRWAGPARDDAVQADLRYPASVEAAMRDSHVAINLVGIPTEGGARDV